ncbi:glutathione S-transferase [Lysobacter daejeonensis GH1-9]|uniref:Glutathione S-transferase n=1 Tax=Lysobacter daejeonensis GH1-9 TaxID=1385517 RepID=A0A0A0F4L5_9GAMM|nr:glutathione S-transferase family protein [Lysobacter daejeonensis]KGM56312.1 glutathione S-transferase [Lysobacter daejeonensis GH1-9]
MYRLHIANKNYSSWSLRPWVLMQVLGIPFEESLTPFAAAGAPNPFRSFSPSGQVPCLIHGGRSVWDSLAITEYLAESHPTVWPVDSVARAWARCAAAEMHAGFRSLRTQCSMSCGVRVALDSISPATLADLARIDALWNEGLTRFGGPFLAGPDFTAVDAFFAPVAFRIQTYTLPLSQPALDYASRLLALPAMKAWYDAALAETWRDEAHEQEMRDAGRIVSDLRSLAD